MKTKIALSGLVAVVCLATSAFLTRGSSPANTAVSRPPIVGIANIALRVSNAAEADHFFGQILGFDRLPLQETAKGKMKYAYYKVNNYQYLKISPTRTSSAEDGFIHIAFRTTNARQLRAYLAAHGVTVPASVTKDPQGDLSFNITDPAGHQIQFIQYLPGSVEMRNKGKYLAPGRISHEIIHAGETVPNEAAENHLFKNILGYREMWRGGMTNEQTDWVDMVVPNGQNWLEYMLHVHNPSPRTRGVVDHFSLGVKDPRTVYATVKDRGLKNPAKPQIGRDGKWQLNLYDQALTRVEVMAFKPTGKPCCSVMKTFH